MKYIFSILIYTFSTATFSQSIIIGNPTQIVIKADPQLNTSRCNLRIIITIGDGINQTIVDKMVQGPDFETSIELTAQSFDPINIEWSNGPGVRDGWSFINGCKGQGSKKIYTGIEQSDAKLQWDRFFSTYEPLYSECVKGGLNYYNIKIQSNDKREAVAGPQVLIVSPIPRRCTEFIEEDKSWGKSNQNSFKCLVDNKSSTCEGYFAQRLNDGRLKIISTQEAVKLHFNQIPWTTGIRETDLGKITRIKIEEERNKQPTEAEKQRQITDSLEFKKEQAEILKLKTLHENVKQKCERQIKDRWERVGTDKYGRYVQEKFIGWFPNGPFGPSKYGENRFWVFNLVLEKGSNRIDFKVDCVFDSSGRVLGIEVRRD